MNTGSVEVVVLSMSRLRLTVSYNRGPRAGHKVSRRVVAEVSSRHR